MMSLDKIKSLAVLATCHNRRELTVKCISDVYKAATLSAVELDIYLVDDGSTDGTAAAIQSRFPKVKIIQGSGALYWNGGMRVAFQEALSTGYDWYLWLNDDTFLYEDSLRTLLATSEAADDRAIIVGSVHDGPGREVNYGGIAKWTRLNSKLVEPKKHAQPCETMFGNCVLIPSWVAQVLGNLDPAFTHSMGDVDYGLRATNCGVRILVMPGFAGVCKRNPVRGTHLDSALPAVSRLKKLTSVKGLPPRQFFTFLWRHFRLRGLVYWCWTYVSVLARAPRQ